VLGLYLFQFPSQICYSVTVGDPSRCWVFIFILLRTWPR